MSRCDSIEEAGISYCEWEKKYGMETSFMYHCLGLRAQECTCTRYEGGRIIFEIRTRDDKL